MAEVASRIDLAPLLETGRPLETRGSLAIPAFGAYTFPEAAVVDVRLRRIGSGVEIDGGVDVTAVADCVRCLEEARIALHLDVDEALVPDSARLDPLDEGNVLDGNTLDLGDLVRQLIDSALPLTLACDAACPGLCDGCGARRGTCGCESSPVETTWRT